MDETYPIEYVTIEAFGHTFRNLLPGHAQDLRTIEQEGAVYCNFADRDSEGNFLDTFTRYRIELAPAEIFEYVEAHLAMESYKDEINRTNDFAAAVLAVKNEKFRKRVVEYGEYGNTRTKNGVIIDNRGCLASFLGADLEALVCGWRPERYEALSKSDEDGGLSEYIAKGLMSLALAARQLKERAHGRPAFFVENEYDVQDLAEVVLRPYFPDLVREEWTPKVAGSAKRMDLVVPGVGAVIECKYVRDGRHAKSIADELRIDFECYHEYQSCRQVYAYVYDPHQLIVDHEQFAENLNGLRRKRDHEFTVTVIMGG